MITFADDTTGVSAENPTETYTKIEILALSIWFEFGKS